MRVWHVEIGACTAADLDRLARTGAHNPRSLRRHEDRFAIQQRGGGWHLLAWNEGRVVGQVTLLNESKYRAVRAVLGSFPEMNGLEANPRGKGIGTRLVDAAERLADAQGATSVGLAVECANVAARNLYERLGYSDWGLGLVVDEWAERDEEGNVITLHQDQCIYLVKRSSNR